MGGRKEFRERIEKIEGRIKTVEEKIEETSIKIRRAIEEKRKEGAKEKGNARGWWDFECKKKRKKENTEKMEERERKL